MSWRFRKPKFIPLVMSVGAVLLMFGLGTWQLQRLAWKEDIIASMERAAAGAPMQAIPDDAKAIAENQFRTVQLTGEYLPEYEFDLAARYWRNTLGYSILTPFRLPDNRIVLINRGWVPTDHKDPATRAEDLSGTRTITGMIRASDERNTFTPKNQPERNLWFGRDVAEMASFSKLDLEPLTIDLIGPQDSNLLPVPSDGKITLRNDHLGYAITWFAVGFGMLVITLLYHRKEPDEA